MTVPCPVCLHVETIRRAGHSATPELKWRKIPRRNPFNTADTLIQRSVAMRIARLDNGFWECEACGAGFNRRDAVVLLDSVLKADLLDVPAQEIEEMIFEAFNGGK
jgi:hypothetical protein